MKTPARHIKVGLLLLSIPLLLWIILLLFYFRVANIFDAYLMKFPGPMVVWGAMSICPLGAMLVGVKMIRKKQIESLGWMFTTMGTLLLAAFILLIGIPLVNEALKPETPKNPSTPRPVEPQAGLPVFPGAEGFGTRTIAGRGGKVIEVTSLADDGPGTLRAALNELSPRIIIFRVSGIIELKSELQIIQPFVTIAGQTAPGGGVCIKGAGISTTRLVF